MHLYIIRHAQALSNIGLADTPNSVLSKLGEEQALTIPGFFKEKEVDIIFSSPFRRVIKTAIPLAKYKKMPIKLVPEMCEHFNEDWKDYRDHQWESCETIVGEFENVEFIESFKGEKWWPTWPEKNSDVRQRVQRFYDTTLKKLFKENKTVVVFGHGHTTGDLAKIVCPDSEYETPNAMILEFEINAEGECVNSTSHLNHLKEKITY